MRKISLILMAIILFYSCKNENLDLENQNFKIAVPMVKSTHVILDSIKTRMQYGKLLRELSKNVVKDSVLPSDKQTRTVIFSKAFYKFIERNKNVLGHSAVSPLVNKSQIVNPWPFSYNPIHCPNYDTPNEDLCTQYWYYECNAHCDFKYYYETGELYLKEQGIVADYEIAKQVCALLPEGIDKEACFLRAEFQDQQKWADINLEYFKLADMWDACSEDCAFKFPFN